MENKTLALIASFIAMGFVVISYFVKKKEQYLLFQLLGLCFLIINYFFSLEFFAMIGVALGGIRALTFFIYEKNEKNAPIIWSFAFSILTITSYFIINYVILETSKPLDSLCLLGLILYAFIFRIRDLKIVRFTMLLPTVLTFLFNLLTQAAIFATLAYAFELLANIISILKYHVFNKESATQND